MKASTNLKKPFGTAKMVDIAHARYLSWEPRSLGTTETEQPQVGPKGGLAGLPNRQHAFDVEFDDGLSFLEPHRTIRKANGIAREATPLSVEIEPETRSGFFVHYDNGQTAEVSWAFIRELPPKPARK